MATTAKEACKTFLFMIRIVCVPDSGERLKEAIKKNVTKSKHAEEKISIRKRPPPHHRRHADPGGAERHLAPFPPVVSFPFLLADISTLDFLSIKAKDPEEPFAFRILFTYALLTKIAQSPLASKITSSGTEYSSCP